MAARFESVLQDTHAKNSKGSLALNPEEWKETSFPPKYHYFL